ncbi:hypothetical protein [Nocardioides bizhenqiangii]|uniref:WD40 repeat domain-containing protein n=1 Tax=Nocardioides bizhenqiangii TaxID=3095076 RepID=A0ABZ0ZWN0_9ACTN|nr:hypothetical protein [Nocardioides sp. HM61]WQQ28384.1 hypothetical protein SHK19_09165 [Nocardioides sp. HM61]
MTEQLKTMMDRAADQDFAAVDLDAITGAGERTLRRRRVATGVAGVAVLAVVATVAAVFGGDDGDRKTDFVDEPFRTDVPMWTEGSTLHTPEATYDLGVDVASFVRTSEGIVFLGWDGNREGRFGVYSFAGEGEPKQIGETQDSRLRSDPEAPYVGWLDGTGDDPEAVVFDVSGNELVWSEPAGIEENFPFVAVDGDQTYLEGSPLRVVDLTSRTVTELPDVAAWTEVVSIEDDLVARAEGTRDEGEGTLLVGPGGEARVRIPGVATEAGLLSPDGRWISVFDEQVQVYDTRTGERVAVDAGHPAGLGYDWLDGDTLLAIAGAANPEQIDLLQCEIPAGGCEQVASLGGFEAGELYSISFGEAIWGIAASAEGSDVDVTSTVSTAEPPE